MIQIILENDTILQRYMDGYIIELPRTGDSIVIEETIYTVIGVKHFLESVHRIEIHIVEIE
tara:strand:+ start:475 stop:657 length:183 start_codon:yes stop_codon:yes gene_type:complete